MIEFYFLVLKNIDIIQKGVLGKEYEYWITFFFRIFERKWCSFLLRLHEGLQRLWAPGLELRIKSLELILEFWGILKRKIEARNLSGKPDGESAARA